MKKSFLQMIVCPLCAGALILESFDDRDGALPGD